MAEDQPVWRSGANAAVAERVIKGVERLVEEKSPREGKTIHISTGLTKLAESLKAEGTDPKWREEAGVIQEQIKRGRNIEMSRVSQLEVMR